MPRRWRPRLMRLEFIIRWCGTKECRGDDAGRRNREPCHSGIGWGQGVAGDMLGQTNRTMPAGIDRCLVRRVVGLGGGVDRADRPTRLRRCRHRQYGDDHLSKKRQTRKQHATERPRPLRQWFFGSRERNTHAPSYPIPATGAIGAHLLTGRSGEGNSQWGGRPRPPAGGSRHRLVASGWVLPPLATSRAGTPAPLMSKKSGNLFTQLP